MFEWLWKRLVGGGNDDTKKKGTKKKATKKAKVVKAKPTAAKKTTKSTSSLTAVRSRNTRPSSSSNTTVARKGTTVRSSFDDMYDKLKLYKQANGHCSVPSSYEKDKSLANFVRRVRTQYKKSKEGNNTKSDLTKDQIKKLESIDFEWEAKRGRKAKQGVVH